MSRVTTRITDEHLATLIRYFKDIREDSTVDALRELKQLRKQLRALPPPVAPEPQPIIIGSPRHATDTQYMSSPTTATVDTAKVAQPGRMMENNNAYHYWGKKHAETNMCEAIGCKPVTAQEEEK